VARVFTGQMLFLSPKKDHESIEGSLLRSVKMNVNSICDKSR